jgi:hypothetical protein
VKPSILGEEHRKRVFEKKGGGKNIWTQELEMFRKKEKITLLGN